MDAKYVRLFMAAMKQGNDAVALSLLEKGHVTVRSLVTDGVPNFISAPCAVLIPAISFEREQVVRALLRLGANLDEFVDIDSGSANAVGFAVLFDSVSMLALFHGLGAEMSDVFKPSSPGLVPPPSIAGHSALETSILQRKPVCLIYALETINPERPIALTHQALCLLCASAKTGPSGGLMDLFRILKTRGFGFECLGRPSGMELNSLGEIQAGVTMEGEACVGVQLSFSDLLLMGVQKRGDAVFMRFLVKDLGLASDSGRMDAWLEFLKEAEEKFGLPGDTHGSPDAELVKYKCSACPAVCVTMWCTGCKVTRYCSKECQGTHWKTGDHKKECKKLQQGAAQDSAGCVGPSQVKK